MVEVAFLSLTGKPVRKLLSVPLLYIYQHLTFLSVLLSVSCMLVLSFHFSSTFSIEYRQTLETFQDGLAKFAGLPAKGVTFLSIQDPATTAPSGYNGKDAVSVWAPSGRVKVL